MKKKLPDYDPKDHPRRDTIDKGQDSRPHPNNNTSPYFDEGHTNNGDCCP